MIIRPGPLLSIPVLILAAAGMAAETPPPPVEAAPQTQPAPTTQRTPQTQPTGSTEGLTAERAAERLAAVTAELATIPADAAENTPEAQRRASLQKRIALYKEYIGLLATAEQQAATLAGAVGRLQFARQQVADFVQSKPATLPALTQESFEALKAILTQQRDRVATLRAGITFRRTRMDAIPQLVADARIRADDADKRAARLAEDLSAATDVATRKIIEAKADNARLERYVALRLSKTLLAEADTARATEPIRAAELELAEKLLERVEQQFAVYSQARQDQLAREQQRKADELARKQQEAANAQSPADRFVARWESEIALSEKNQSDLSSQSLELKTEADEQDRRFTSEKDELTRLQEFIKLAGATERTSDRIKQALQLARQRRVVINKAMRDTTSTRIADYRNRRFDIEDALVALNDRFKSERDAVLAKLPEAERPALLVRTSSLLDRSRTALRAEKDLLIETIGHWNHLQTLYFSRLNKQEQIERFIRANAFWLRDAKPLGLDMAGPFWKECMRLADWAGDLITDTVLQRTIRSARSVWGVLSGLLLFPILPIILIAIRARLRRFVAERSDDSANIGRTLANRLSTIGVAVVSAALLPVYWYVAAQLLSATTDLAVPAQIIEFLSFFLFFWLLARSFLGRGSKTHVQLEIPRDAATSLYASIRLTLLGCGLFLIPTVILRRPPFEFETLPRLLDTLLQCSVGLAIAWLIRPRSDFMRHALAAGESSFLSRRWGTISLLIVLLIITIIGLDVAGYRYGSLNMSAGFVKSIVALVILVPVYTGTRAAVETLLRRRVAVNSASAEETADQDARTEQRIQRVVRFSFVILALYLLAGFWGVDAQAIKALDDVRLRTIRGTGDNEEFLSAADVLRCLIYFGGTFWVLWALPGIYELAVFPRIKVDHGLKYAILTISRYAVFAIGVALGLSAVHLDLARLGWLVAAISVGLGFGLQEIVSNFVCGIILLVERPVQVGDIVTVSGMSGTVTRINIRATTILNFDRQEVILPNRNLITSEVTNWTRGDTINRTVIKIGVAYGSDIDLVTRLLSEIARDDPGVMNDPPSAVIFTQHGESTLDFELRVFMPTPDAKAGIHDRINKAINRKFAENKIEIPFPQRELHVRSLPDTVRIGAVDQTPDSRGPAPAP